MTYISLYMLKIKPKNMQNRVGLPTTTGLFPLNLWYSGEPLHDLLIENPLYAVQRWDRLLTQFFLFCL